MVAKSISIDQSDYHKEEISPTSAQNDEIKSNKEQTRIKDSTSSTSSSASNNTVMTTGPPKLETSSMVSINDLVSKPDIQSNALPVPVSTSRLEESLDKSTSLSTSTKPDSESDPTILAKPSTSTESIGSKIIRNSFNSSSQKQNNSSSANKSVSNTSNSFKSHRHGGAHPPQRTFSIKDYTLYPPGGRGSAYHDSKQQPVSGIAQSGSATGVNKLNRWLSSVASSETSSDRNSSMEDFTASNLSKSNQNLAGTSYSSFANNQTSHLNQKSKHLIF